MTSETVKSIVCWDYNSLYASVLKDDLFPYGIYGIRSKPDFKLVLFGEERKHSSYLWLQWIEHREGKPVQSLFRGSEQFVWIPEEEKCFRTDGCITLYNGLLMLFEYDECSSGKTCFIFCLGLEYIGVPFI